MICFTYGLLTRSSSDNTPSNDICDDSRLGNTTLCPICEEACSYIKLSNSCLYSKISYVFDNQFTVVYAIFMSFWGEKKLDKVNPAIILIILISHDVP